MFQADHVFRLKIAFLRDELFQGDFFLLRIAFLQMKCFRATFFLLRIVFLQMKCFRRKKIFLLRIVFKLTGCSRGARDSTWESLFHRHELFQGDFFPFEGRFSTDEMFQAQINVPLEDRCQTHELFQAHHSDIFHLRIVFIRDELFQGAKIFHLRIVFHEKIHENRDKRFTHERPTKDTRSAFYTVFLHGRKKRPCFHA